MNLKKRKKKERKQKERKKKKEKNKPPNYDINRYFRNDKYFHYPDRKRFDDRKKEFFF